jgi:hypothetical protein
VPTLLDTLPALYRDLLPDFFGQELPVEEKATCANCAMCETNARGVVDSVDGKRRFFRPDTKCCTFHPRLPNYLVGALLADARPELAEGRRRVEEKVQRRVGATPQFLRPPPKYSLLYGNMHEAFGRASTLVCPYYEKDGGKCTVWAYREAVCSTWHCKYVAGDDGRKLWMEVKQFLMLAEMQLSRFALLELHPDFLLKGRDKQDPTRQPLRPEDLDDEPLPEREYRALWGKWAGREVELYRAAHEVVRGVSRAQLRELMGLDGLVELKVLDTLHAQATAPVLPAVLRFNPEATVKWLPDGSVALGCYSENDAVALPGEAYPLLVMFDGRAPVEEVRRRMREEKQADLGPEVLTVLHQHRILTEA